MQLEVADGLGTRLYVCECVCFLNVDHIPSPHPIYLHTPPAPTHPTPCFFSSTEKASTVGIECEKWVCSKRHGAPRNALKITFYTWDFAGQVWWWERPYECLTDNQVRDLGSDKASQYSAGCFSLCCVPLGK